MVLVFTLAAACTDVFLNKFNNIKAVFNFGSVGGREVKLIKKFQIIIPEKIYFHDVVTPWYSRGQIPYQPKYFENSFLNTMKHSLGTGMTFITSNSQLVEINMPQLTIFDMEAAAIAQICKKNVIPFFCVKCISDIINKKNSITNLEIHIKKAGQKSFNYVLKIYKFYYLKVFFNEARIIIFRQWCIFLVFNNFI